MVAPFDGTRWSNKAASYPTRWAHATYKSAANGGVDIGYTYYVPASYASSEDRYPVVYMLHGKGGNENMWPKLGFAPTNCIIVCPNGGKKSKYFDAVPGSPMDNSYEVESAIINELIPHIDATLRTKADRDHRALQGFSMGGNGTLRLGFKHLDMFGSLYTFSAAVNDTVINLPTTEALFIANMLGGDLWRYEPERAQTLATERAASIIASGIKIKGAVGSKDGLKKYNVEMYDQLKALGIPNEGLAVVADYGHVPDYVPALKPIAWASKWFPE